MTSLVGAGMPVAWLVARAAGLVAFGLLTIAVTLGLTMSTRLLKPQLQKELLGWHQTLIWTGLAMLALHGGAILLDPVMRFGFSAVLIPGAAPWRPVTVASGVVAGYLMLALAASFRVRRRIGQRRWRLLHYASFVAFALALGHALHAGTDLRGNAGLVFAAIALAPVLWLAFARILMPRPGRPSVTPTAARRPAGGTDAAIPRTPAGAVPA
jgi:DMSO/TMAO reductase YedYZ heme-binding membrane subunit